MKYVTVHTVHGPSWGENHAQPQSVAQEGDLLVVVAHDGRTVRYPIAQVLRWIVAPSAKRQVGGTVITDNPSQPVPPGCEPAAPVEPPQRSATAPGAPDPWYEDETEWFDQLSPPWWGHLYRAWQTIEQWIIDNRPTSREWQ